MPLKFNPLVFGGLDYFQTAAVTKEYKAKAAGGLELGGAESNEFAIKALGITEAMIASEAIGSATIHKEAVTAEKIGSEAVTEEKIKTEAVTNAKIIAAAGIPESKLSLPEVVKKTGEQKIEGPFKFNSASGGALIALRNETRSFASASVTNIEAPLKLTFTGAGGVVRMMNLSGEVKYEGNPEATATAQILQNAVVFKSIGNLTMSPIYGLRIVPKLTPAEGSATTGWASIPIVHEPVLSKVEAGTAAGSMVGLVHGGSVGENWTVAEHGAVHMKATTGAGTVTEEYGLKVENLTAGTNNYSVNSLGAAVKLKHAGPIEMTKGFGAWAKTPPVAQHAALPAPKTLLEVEAWAVEVDAVFKEYGMTA